MAASALAVYTVDLVADSFNVSRQFIRAAAADIAIKPNDRSLTDVKLVLGPSGLTGTGPGNEVEQVVTHPMYIPEQCGRQCLQV